MAGQDYFKVSGARVSFVLGLCALIAIGGNGVSRWNDTQWRIAQLETGLVGRKTESDFRYAELTAQITTMRAEAARRDEKNNEVFSKLTDALNQLRVLLSEVQVTQRVQAGGAQ